MVKGKNLPNDTVTVTNTGGGTLSYRISDNVAWLQTSPTSGTSTGEADPISIIYSTADLAAGNYSAAIDVADPNATNSPRTLTVHLEVKAAGDFDDDQDVDQEDFGYFQTCLSGSDEPFALGCGNANFDGDNDVDQADFAIFLGCMAGANRPPGC